MYRPAVLVSGDQDFKSDPFQLSWRSGRMPQFLMTYHLVLVLNKGRTSDPDGPASGDRRPPFPLLAAFGGLGRFHTE